MTWSSGNPAGSRTEVAPAEWRWAELEPGSVVDPRDANDPTRAARLQEEIDRAYQKGLEDGRIAATGRARAELSTAMSVAHRVLDDVQAGRAAWAATLEENLVLLATAIARQIVDREIASDPEITLETVKRAVASFPSDEPLRIRVHPDDLSRIEGSIAPSGEGAPSRAVRWIPDAEMSRGGCIVEGPDKILEGRIEEAITRIVRVLSNG